MPAGIRDNIGRAFRNMNLAGMARMAIAAQAYLSILGMTMVRAVDEEIQRALDRQGLTLPLVTSTTTTVVQQNEDEADQGRGGGQVGFREPDARVG